MSTPWVLTTASVVGCLLLLPASLPGQPVTPFRLKLVPSDVAPGDELACAVAVEDDTLLAGSFADGSGAVYLYRYEDGAWNPRDKVAALDTEAGDCFGSSVSLSEATALVGAPFEDDGGDDAGAAYVFVVENGDLRQEDKLTASDAAPDDGFGSAVDTDGTRAVVGAPGRDAGGRDAGAVYVFERGPGGWSQQAILEPGDPGPGDRFGRSLALGGELVVVGAPFDDDRGTDSGSVYVFRRRGAEWLQEAKLVPAGATPFDAFGYAVATDGRQVVVGAPRHGDGGAVYFYRSTQTGWVLETRFDAPRSAAGSQLGTSVAIDSDRAATDLDQALVGARLADDAAPDAGTVFRFQRSTNGWVAVDRLVAGDAAPNDELGLGVALSGLTVVAGAYRDEADGAGVDEDTGAIYLLAPETELSLTLTSQPSAAGGQPCRQAHSIVGPGELVPGCGVEYTLEVTNAGPEEVSGVEVRFPVTRGARSARRGDAVPLTKVAWCLVTGDGECKKKRGDISEIVDLPAGASLTYTVTARIPPGARGALARSASLGIPVGVLGPRPAAAADTAPLTPVAEASVELSRSFDPDDPTPGCAEAADLVEPGEVVPGCAVVYTLKVRNKGPSRVDGVARVEETSGLLSDFTWTCTATRGKCTERSGMVEGRTTLVEDRVNFEDRVNLPRGGHLTYSLRGTLPPEARGTLDTSASVTLPEDVLDLTEDDRSTEESATLRPVAEAAVSPLSRAFDPDDPTLGCAKAAELVELGEVVPGCAVTYTFEVSNGGPSQVDGVVRLEETSQLLQDFTWTCTSTPGDLCADSGSGNEESVTLLRQSHLTYSFRGTLPPAALGALETSASVTLPEDVLDPTRNNQSMEDRAALRPVVDLGVTLVSDPPAPEACSWPGQTAQAPGCPAGREMTITNDGPSAIPLAVLLELEVAPPAASEASPESLRDASTPDSETGLNDLKWTCEPSGGAACSPGMDGNVADEAMLPVGGKVTYHLSASVDGLARGELRTAASFPEDVLTLEPIQPVLSSVTLEPVVAGEVLNPLDIILRGNPPVTAFFRFEVANPGPSAMDSAHDQLRVILHLPPAFSPGRGISPMTGEWTCTPDDEATCKAGGTGDIVDTELVLPAGKKVIYELDDAVIERVGLLIYPVFCASAAVRSGPGPTRMSTVRQLGDLTGGVSGIMEIDERRTTRETAVYNVTLTSDMARSQFDNFGDEFRIDLPPKQLRLQKASCANANANCKCATCQLLKSRNRVTWNGPICPGNTIQFTIEAAILAETDTEISVQGQIHYDTEGDGTNDATAMTAPAAGEEEGPTVFTVKD